MKLKSKCPVLNCLGESGVLMYWLGCLMLCPTCYEIMKKHNVEFLPASNKAQLRGEKVLMVFK